MIFLKLLPVFVFGGLMLGGLDILLAAPLATATAVLVALGVDKFSYRDIYDAALENVKHFNGVFFILMMAYALAETFMATGVGASIIITSLKLGISAKTVAVVGLFATAVLSIATGTSWGTFAACAPVFLWLSHIIGGDPVLTIAAVAGGSCFGDNIGLISDTTVVSSGIQEVEIIHRIRHQGVWSFLCLLISAAIFYMVSCPGSFEGASRDAASVLGTIPPEVMTTLAEKRASAVTLLEQVQSGVPPYMMMPLGLVLVMAVLGVSTLLCLGAGILAALAFGFAAGTVTSLAGFLELVYTGFSDAGSWCIVMMMWVGAFGGVMRLMKAFDPVARLVLGCAKNVRQLIFSNGLLCLLGNAALGDEMAQIVTIGPIIKDLTQNNIKASEENMYRLRLRNATLSDAFGVLGSQLIPWHCYMVFFLGIAHGVYPLHNFTPLDLMGHNFLAFVSVGSMLLLTYTGWDRFIPLFGIPREPQAELHKKV